MTNRSRRTQVCVLGSAEPGSDAFELAGQAGELLARLGITVVSGCGSPATRVAAQRALACGGLVISILPSDERQNSPILPWRSAATLEQQLRSLGLVPAVG